MVLTPREKEVIAYLQYGLTTREIAIRLNIARATVRAHVSSIKSKLNARNIAHAVALYLGKKDTAL